MEVLRAPDGALNLAMASCFWNLLEGETPPLPPFHYGPGSHFQKDKQEKEEAVVCLKKKILFLHGSNNEILDCRL